MKEKEEQMNSVLSQKDAEIKQLKKDKDKLLMDKNLEMEHHKTEKKAMLSGQVNFNRPVHSSITMKKMGDEGHSPEEESAQLMVTPTPVKARRGEG